MELQNQVYLVIAAFGGSTVLLLVLIIMLAVYVKKTRTLLEDYKMGHSPDGHNPPGMDDGDRRPRKRMDNGPHGYPMDAYGHGMPPRGDLTKTRNDYMHNMRNINGARHGGPYRNDVDPMGYMGGKRGAEKPMKATPHGGPRSQGSVQDSALELEVANIFDMDELDEEDLSDCNSGPTDHDDVMDPRYMPNGPDGPPGHGRPKRPPNGHQYERDLGRPGVGEGRGNRFQNPHAAMKSKNGGKDGGRGDAYGNGGKQHQDFYDN